jgi:hypothetical protein
VREVELEVLEVRVAVVPGDELGRRPRAGQVLAGDPEPSVGLRTDGVDDRVVDREQIVVRDGRADLDVAEETEARPGRGLLERARDRLDVLVIGRDAEADEPPRRRQAVEQVDLDAGVVALQERVGGVEPGGAGAHDGDADGLVGHGARLACVARCKRRAEELQRVDVDRPWPFELTHGDEVVAAFAS